MRILLRNDAQSEQLPKPYHARTDPSRKGSQAEQAEYLEKTDLPLTWILLTFLLPTVPPTVTTTPSLRIFKPLSPALATNVANSSALPLTASIWLIVCAFFLAGANYRR